MPEPSTSARSGGLLSVFNPEKKGLLVSVSLFTDWAGKVRGRGSRVSKRIQARDKEG